MPAGDELGVAVRLTEQLDGVVDGVGALVLERCGNHCPPPPLACWMAFQTFSGETGRWMSVTPKCESASTTAFTIAGGEAMVPVSPTPFTPSSLVLDGVTVCPIVIEGTSDAAGTS